MLAPVTFVNLIFRNFAWNDDVKSFFCIVGTSWMGWGRVEWYWHMRMSCLTSLNTQLFKNIAYVGSFKHFYVQPFFYMYFATRPRPALTAVAPGTPLQKCWWYLPFRGQNSVNLQNNEKYSLVKHLKIATSNWGRFQRRGFFKHCQYNW